MLAIGFNVNLIISLKVISPTSVLFLSTTGSFSILFFCKITSASVREVPLLTVIKFFFVITSVITLELFFSNLRSLLVTIPLRIPFLFTIGIPPILFSFMLNFASLTIESNGKVIGSMIIPLSALFTFLTLLACSLMDMFLCKTPIPPS